MFIQLLMFNQLLLLIQGTVQFNLNKSQLIEELVSFNLNKLMLSIPGIMLIKDKLSTDKLINIHQMLLEHHKLINMFKMQDKYQLDLLTIMDMDIQIIMLVEQII